MDVCEFMVNLLPVDTVFSLLHSCSTRARTLAAEKESEGAVEYFSCDYLFSLVLYVLAR